MYCVLLVLMFVFGVFMVFVFDCCVLALVGGYMVILASECCFCDLLVMVSCFVLCCLLIVVVLLCCYCVCFACIGVGCDLVLGWLLHVV